MACYNHPDKEAVATCNVCGKPICNDCYVEIGGNSYCKNCLNALINSNEKSNADENVNTNQNQAIENIEPIKKPKTIPYEEEKVDDVPIETPEKIVAPVEKAPENYQPEYDYQTEYVETYGDEDSEDSYYENPETIPEPEPEYNLAGKEIDNISPGSCHDRRWKGFLSDIFFRRLGIWKRKRVFPVRIHVVDDEQRTWWKMHGQSWRMVSHGRWRQGRRRPHGRWFWR